MRLTRNRQRYGTAVRTAFLTERMRVFAGFVLPQISPAFSIMVVVGTAGALGQCHARPHALSPASATATVATARSGTYVYACLLVGSPRSMTRPP